MKILMKQIAEVLLVLFVLASPNWSMADDGKLGEKKWLGVYAGSSIPGYVVGEATFVEISQGAKLDGDIFATLLKELMSYCKEDGGLGLINYSVSYAIGRVPVSTGFGKAGIVDPGIFVHAMGDCVNKVQVLK